MMCSFRDSQRARIGLQSIDRPARHGLELTTKDTCNDID